MEEDQPASEELKPDYRDALADEEELEKSREHAAEAKALERAGDKNPFRELQRRRTVGRPHSRAWQCFLPRTQHGGWEQHFFLETNRTIRSYRKALREEAKREEDELEKFVTGDGHRLGYTPRQQDCAR